MYPSRHFVIFLVSAKNIVIKLVSYLAGVVLKLQSVAGFSKGGPALIAMWTFFDYLSWSEKTSSARLLKCHLVRVSLLSSA